MFHRPRTFAATCVGIVAAGALLAGSAVMPADMDEAGWGRPPDPERAQGVPWGAFLGSGPEGVVQMAKMETWLGGARMRVGHSYLPGRRWSDIEGPQDMLQAWARWRKGAPDRMFVLNVPMLERNEDGVPDGEVGRLLRQGESGAYDRHFRTLAERLVSLGVQDTVIVLGWEMNGITYTGRCEPDPDAWKAYWRRIVEVMRSVPGQRFRFDFAPTRGRDAIPWTRCYPGDDVVDIVGMDSYDQPPGHTFQEQVDQPYGLRDQVEFAEEHSKPTSYPEWGLFRYGDNPEYMRGMLRWIAEHPPAYHTITDYCPHGVWMCGQNPRSAAVFRDVQSYGREPGPSEAECVPFDLGKWIESVVGPRRVCVRFSWHHDRPWLAGASGGPAT